MPPSPFSSRSLTGPGNVQDAVPPHQGGNEAIITGQFIVANPGGKVNICKNIFISSFYRRQAPKMPATIAGSGFYPALPERAPGRPGKTGATAAA
ncbi:MAG TPA: hypothetical protein PL061_04540 [Syntrophales bacterium]|jgi:hypothetical protein|nr:hypothetical protein [Syntrophales bacterium]